MNAEHFPHSISLSSAAILTGLSERTWRRRVNEGLYSSSNSGEAGAPMLVPVDAVSPLLSVSLQADDVAALVRADRGDALAQAEIGALFALEALQTAEGAKNATAHNSNGGGGAALYRHSTFSSRRHNRAKPMPCTGWACCTRQAWVGAIARRWP